MRITGLTQTVVLCVHTYMLVYLCVSGVCLCGHSYLAV